MEDLDRMLDKPHDHFDYEPENLFNPEFYRPGGDAKTWLRIPIKASAFEWPPMAPDRASFYSGRQATTHVTGFHRTSVAAMVGQFELDDWKTGATIRYLGIAKDGFMRNGANDSNHRCVWLYLH